MSRASRTALDATRPQPPDDARAVAAFLRSLAKRVASDSVFAAQIAAALHESGLLTAEAVANLEMPARGRGARAGGSRRAGQADAAPAVLGDDVTPPDPFALLRERGEPGLRAALETLDLASLRAIVRMHRLDPARISARWTTRERVIELIVTQVQARVNHGKAFSRV